MRCHLAPHPGRPSNSCGMIPVLFEPTKPLTWLGITPILNDHPLWGAPGAPLEPASAASLVLALLCGLWGQTPVTAVTEGNRQRFDFFADFDSIDVGNGARGSGHSFVHGADALGLLCVDQDTNLTNRVLTSARRNMPGPDRKSVV